LAKAGAQVCLHNRLQPTDTTVPCLLGISSLQPACQEPPGCSTKLQLPLSILSTLSSASRPNGAVICCDSEVRHSRNHDPAQACLVPPGINLEWSSKFWVAAPARQMCGSYCAWPNRQLSMLSETSPRTQHGKQHWHCLGQSWRHNLGIQVPKLLRPAHPELPVGIAYQ